ncbi:MAG: AMP-binding protein [Bacteroidota bacterium]|nr:AMP-binding protein [Bacteroidota bacterium]
MLYTTCDLINKYDTGFASKIVLIENNEKVTYSELQDKVNKFASFISHKGLKKGDRVAIYLPRSIDAVVALFATWLNGCVGVIINDVLKKQQVNYIIDHSGASLIISNEKMLSSLEAISLTKEAMVRIDQSYAEPGNANFPKVIGSDVALIIYTSGSTGMPKGVILSHTNLISGAYIISDYLKLSHDDIILSLLPFSFDYGLNQLLTVVLVGGTLVIQNSVFPADICKTLLAENITGMAGVPLLWQQLAHERSPFIKKQFPSLRYITNSGGRMPESLTRLFRKCHPHVQIYLMYGLTEAFRSTYLPPSEVDVRPTSMGRAIPNVEILLLNENREKCKAGEVGEVVHRGACVALGYWRDEKNTAERFGYLDFPEHGGVYKERVVFSGDYAKMDEKGYLYYVGRKDQMIKSHSVRVSPEEIEAFLFASDMLAHVVVFAVPKNEVEQSIIAAVMPHDRSTFNSNKLLAYCKTEMPDYMIPSDTWLIENVPQTSTGKPDRVRLKEMYLAREATPKNKNQAAE